MNVLKSLFDKPWAYQGADPQGDSAARAAPERIALRTFLGVAGVLFMLFGIAYFIRMELADWRPMPESPLLWLNTLILFICSVALQWTRGQVQGEQVQGGQVQGESPSRVKLGMVAGGALTLAFIFGQLAVWDQMAAQGYFLAGNPANSFFYLLTGIHGLHLLGGLWVWTRTTFRLWSGHDMKAIRLSVELCALYWHFLLLVWLAIFALLSYT